MTPKMIALRNTLGVFVGGLASGFIMAFVVANFSLAQIAIGFTVVGLLILAHLVYELELTKAESIERLNKLKE